MTPLQQRLGELRIRFVERAGKDRQRISDSFGAGDLSQVHQLSHRLHGIAGTFGFGRISEAAAALETAIEQAQPESQTHALVQELIDELGAIAESKPETVAEA